MGEHEPASILIAFINTPSKNILKRSGGKVRPKLRKPRTSLIPKWRWRGPTRYMAKVKYLTYSTCLSAERAQFTR